MGEKSVDLEWLDVFLDPMSYDEVQEYILKKNEKVFHAEKRWRLPSPHEIRIILHNKAFTLRQVRYMCRSCMSEGKVAAIESNGRLMFFGKETRLHFCLVR